MLHIQNASILYYHYIIILYYYNIITLSVVCIMLDLVTE